MGHGATEGMIGEGALSWMIRLVLAVGLVSAAFTVGSDVSEPDQESSTAATAGPTGGVLDDAAGVGVNKTTPENRSADTHGGVECAALDAHICGALLA